MKTQNVNPLLPTYEYIPDCEPMIFGDRIYIYGSHDRFGGDKYCMNDYVCWSAPIDNPAAWKYEGIIYRREQDPDNKDKKRYLWAPCCVQGADGRYYLYYSLGDWYSKISLAVCDSPCGKFEFLGYVHYPDGTALGQKETDTIPFDPAVLVDDDGRVYLYSGCGPTPLVLRPEADSHKMCVVVELDPSDMLTVINGPKKLLPNLFDAAGTGFEGHEFFEASAIRKYNNKYYFVYSSCCLHELCWSMSDKPDGGFQYGGVLISNGDIFPESSTMMRFESEPNPKVKYYIGNNHGNLIELNGQYFIFYHRHTNRCMFSRQICVERVEMMSDGSFKQAHMTSYGMNGKPLIGKGTYEAAIACHLQTREGATFSNRRDVPAITQEGADRECGPGQYVDGVFDGTTIGYRSFEFKDAKSITVSLRGKGNGKLIIRDELDGNQVAQLMVAPTDDWHEVTGKLTIQDGIHPLYITYYGDGTIDLLSITLD